MSQNTNEATRAHETAVEEEFVRLATNSGRPVNLRPEDLSFEHRAILREEARRNVSVKSNQRLPKESDARVSTTANMARARAGAVQWHLWDEGQRLAAIGVDACDVDREYITSLFGRAVSSIKAAELMKRSPDAYRRAREIARVLNLVGM